MYYHPRRSANEDRVFKQRQYENALQEKVRFVRRYEKLMRYAQFEEVNEPKVTYRSLLEKLDAIRSHRESVLQDRRKRLCCLLEREEEELNQEIRTGTMNLAERRSCLKAQALSLSARKHQNPSSGAHGETVLEKTIQRSYDDMAMHNSRVALMKASEADKKRDRLEYEERRNHRKDLNRSLHCEGSDSELSAKECEHDEHAVDILRRNLHMVEHLREDEMMAVEEDLINMNSRWLDEEEALRRHHVEQRHQQSLEVQKELLGSADYDGDGDESKRREISGVHMNALIAETEAEERRELEEVKELHKKEAIAYVNQLRKAVENQRFEDEELEELIKAKMEEPCHSEPRQFRGINEGAREDERKATDDSKLSKEDLVNVLEDQIRGLNALELVDQETRRVAVQSQGNKGKHHASDMRKKQTLADVVYPEPYFGRKAVKWYD